MCKKHPKELITHNLVRSRYVANCSASDVARGTCHKLRLPTSLTRQKFYDPVPLYFRAPYIQNFTLSAKKMIPITGDSHVSTGISSGRRITRLG